MYGLPLSHSQPAILPMTIDFHPSPQELQDKERFRIKQYSVTLPPMNETNYASHRELLDELVAQRIIQDFQIVPRAIISSRRDATDNILEHTLSMGHKIQNLSYNPSQDSVDVIQYYANFAENETPQIYRYSLYSTLMQVRRYRPISMPNYTILLYKMNLFVTGLR